MKNSDGISFVKTLFMQVSHNNRSWYAPRKFLPDLTLKTEFVRCVRDLENVQKSEKTWRVFYVCLRKAMKQEKINAEGINLSVNISTVAVQEH